MQIKLFISGGSLDKRYNEFSEKMEFKGSYMDEMLKHGRAYLDINVEELMLVDSLDMNMKQRNQIVRECLKTKEKHIVISHGISTVTDTAKMLGEKVKNKTIVLFGSMVPYAVSKSDAQFNLGCALTAVQILTPGVYIVMNGKIYSWETVVRNSEVEELVRA